MSIHDEEKLPLGKLPKLRTTNGTGYTLRGRHDYDPDSNSFISIHCFTFLYIPVCPIAKYRVSLGTSCRKWQSHCQEYEFLWKVPLTKSEERHRKIFIILYLLAIVFLVVAFFYSINHGG